MPFHFSLQTLLRFRLVVEQQRETLLQEARQQIAAIFREIEELDCSLAKSVIRQAAELTAGVTAAKLQFDAVCLHVSAERRQELKKELARREEVLAQRMREFQHARRQREAIDTIREHQIQLYRQQQSRKEQRRLDELLLIRRAFLRRD